MTEEDRKPAAIDLSVVVAVWNERPSLEALFAELLPVLRGLDLSFEVLPVDDGSSDGSLAELERLSAIHPEIRVLRLSEHRGKAAGMCVGFDAARGARVVTMDADLQDVPTEIPRLLSLASPDTVVVGIRNRADTRWRRSSSAIARTLRHALVRDRFVDIGCPLRVLPRHRLANLPQFEGMHRFLPVILEARGAAVAQLPIDHRPRRFGASKYDTLGRAVRGAAHLAWMSVWLRREARRAARAGANRA